MQLLLVCAISDHRCRIIDLNAPSATMWLKSKSNKQHRQQVSLIKSKSNKQHQQQVSLIIFSIFHWKPKAQCSIDINSLAAFHLTGFIRVGKAGIGRMCHIVREGL